MTTNAPAAESADVVVPAVLPVAAAATGIGSLPGTDIGESVALVLGECDLPYLPELPGRGPGADLVGRTMARLAHVDPAFSVTTTPSGWRLTDRPGRDVRRASSWWREDLDALEERATDYVGPIKVSLAGPLTLAAAIELVSGEKVLRDAGARRDISAATSEAVVTLAKEVRARIPGAWLVLQIDEPSLPAVLAGNIKTASGLTSLRPIDAVEAESLLGAIVTTAHAVGAAAIVHSCAAAPPLAMLQRAGFDGLSIDATLLVEADYDELGAAIDRDTTLLLGVVPTDRSPNTDAALKRITHLQRQLSFDDATWLPRVAVSPTCGLALLQAASARAITDTVRSVARALRGSATLDPYDE